MPDSVFFVAAPLIWRWDIILGAIGVASLVIAAIAHDASRARA